MRTAGFIAVAMVAAFVTGVIAYIALTWMLMRAHTEPRSLHASMRSAAREFRHSVVIQALRPLFFLFRKRWDGGNGSVPIVFVHGYMGAHIDFVGMVKKLKHRKVGAFFGFNYPWMFTIERSAELLGAYIEYVRAKTNQPKVDLVCHSLGGVVALHYIETGGDRWVRRCVTVASPHAGVAWKGPMPAGSSRQLKRDSRYFKERESKSLTTECLSIYSSHDNIVHPPTTSSLATRGGEDLLVKDLGHLEILFDENVINEVANYLERDAS